MKQMRIGIVGAGPGGLVLARCLYQSGIKPTVFEREPHASARTQGGSLDMHAESGQYALECAGLSAEFRAVARYEDQESRVFDQLGVLRFKDDCVEGKNRPEVDRGQLRQILIDSLPGEATRWDHAVTAVERKADGSFRLTFCSGEIEIVDLVVGADGTWSRIRPLLSEAAPIYSGITFVELGIDHVDLRYPELAARMGRGLSFALGDSKALIAHRDANAHLGIYAVLRAEEDWVARRLLDRTSPESSRHTLAAHFQDWSPELLELILHSDDRIVPRGIYALPVGHRWVNCPGATMLGDAAHVMSPFGGDGANLAMLDGAELALGLTSALATGSDWREAVREFEETMFIRAEAAARGAWDAIQEVFSETGIEHMLAAMDSQRA